MPAIRSSSAHVLVAALVPLGLTGCGGSAASTSAPTPTAVTATASASPTSAATAIPADFPLAQGLVDDDETKVTGPAPDAPGIRLESVCGLTDWAARARDRLAVQQVGPESSETRELAVFHSPVTARAAMSRVANAVDQCPRQTGVPAAEASRFRLFERVIQNHGRPVTAFAETLAGNRPGGAVYVFVRVGRAVLATSRGGEWTRESTPRGVRQLLSDDGGLLTAMEVFASTPR